MLRLLKNKKGDVTDIIMIGFWLLIMGIGIFAIMFFSNSTITPLKDTVIGEDVNALAALNSWQNYSNLAVPGTFLIIFFALLLGVIVSSFFIRTHPIFIPVYILFALISIVVAVILGNVWGNLKDVSEFQTILDTNTITNIMDVIMSNMVLVTLSVFIITLVIIFAKPGGGQVNAPGGSTPY